MRLRFLGLVFLSASSLLAVSSFSACSSDGPRPDAGSVVNSASSSGTTVVIDSGSDTGADAAACFNGTKDGSETDVDCGGQCAPCVENKLCSKKEDCQPQLECEVAEVGKLDKKCRVGTCIDTATNGGETDLNCGGVTGCERCTVGKRCLADVDCRSAKCNTAQQVCACPTGMTIVSLAGGGAYCIDSTEVTKGEYNKFITANVPTSSQTGPCVGNADFVPTAAWPPATSPPEPAPNGLPYSMGLPVHYVDWCDAVAYCKWAKKELCGKIGGGPVSQAQANTAGTAAWYDACSAQGTKTWPYGPDYVAQKCNDFGGADGGPTNHGYLVNGDDGVWLGSNSDAVGNIVSYANTTCQGGAVGLFQMAGNAAEWENSCSDETTAGAMCNIRGGSYNAVADEQDAGVDAGTYTRCNAVRQLPRNQAFKDVGFRCCLY